MGVCVCVCACARARVTIASGGSCLLYLRKASAWQGCGATLWPSLLHLPYSSWHWAGYLNRQHASCVLGPHGLGLHVVTYGEEEEATRFRWEIWVELEDLGEDGRMILMWVLKKCHGRAWTGLMWFRIGTTGGLLWKQLWTFKFHNVREICWLVEAQLASQDGLYSVEFVG